MTSTSTKPHVLAFIDESERGDTFVLTAALVYSSQYDELERQWLGLRHRIRDELLSGPADTYPYAKEKSTSDSNWLPEIHAHDMYQSTERTEYEKYDRKRPPPQAATDRRYDLRHRIWLSEAFQIQKACNVAVISLSWDKSVFGPDALNTGPFSEIVRKCWNPEYDRPPRFDKILVGMDRLQQRPFTTAFLGLLEILEATFEARGERVGLILDDDGDQRIGGGLNRGYLRSKLYDVLHEQGYQYPHLSPLAFPPSHEHSGLQVADLHAFFHCRHLSMQAEGKEDLAPKLWHVDYTRTQMLGYRVPSLTPTIRARVFALALDYVLSEAPFPPDTKRDLRVGAIASFSRVTDLLSKPAEGS
jgi:Protein of unknown function (DUF3800)